MNVYLSFPRVVDEGSHLPAAGVCGESWEAIYQHCPATGQLSHLPSLLGSPARGLLQAEGCLGAQGGSQAPSWRGQVFLWEPHAGLHLKKFLFVFILCYLAKSQEMFHLTNLSKQGLFEFVSLFSPGKLYRLYCWSQTILNFFIMPWSTFPWNTKIANAVLQNTSWKSPCFFDQDQSS